MGLAVGDSLGANLEFTISDHTEITDDMVAMRSGMWPRGAWTDDTSMALCLGHSLLERGGYDSFDVMKKYQDWIENGYCAFDEKPAADVGNTIRASVREFVENPIIVASQERSDQAGNGCVMRLAPIVLASLQESPAAALELARISARETHYSYEAEAAAEIFAAMLRQATTETNKLAVTDVAKFSTGNVYNDMLSYAADGVLATRHELEDLGGYVADSLRIAVWGLHNFITFADGMRAVIKLGGDTDTNGAIYGQLAGAYYGYDNIPSEWRQDLIDEPNIAKLADDLAAMKSCPILKTRFEEDGPLGPNENDETNKNINNSGNSSHA